ncbi:MAG: polyribonucleotide nucleotidyltransferase [Clostridia bacterium]
MDLSSIMGQQVAQLQQLVGMSLLKTQQATDAAQAAVMLQDFTAANAAPHPSLGNQLDIRV